MEERAAMELFKEAFLRSEELQSVFDYKKEELVKMMDEAERLDNELFERVDRLVRGGLYGSPMLSLAIVELIDDEDFKDYKERCVGFYEKAEDKFLKDGLEYFAYAKDNFLNQSHGELIDSIISDFENKNINADTSYRYEILLTRTDFLKLENEANIPKHIDEIGGRLWEYFTQGGFPTRCEKFIETVKFWEGTHIDYDSIVLYDTRQEYYETYGNLG